MCLCIKKNGANFPAASHHYTTDEGMEWWGNVEKLWMNIQPLHWWLETCTKNFNTRHFRANFIKCKDRAKKSERDGKIMSAKTDRIAEKETNTHTHNGFGSVHQIYCLRGEAALAHWCAQSSDERVFPNDNAVYSIRVDFCVWLTIYYTHVHDTMVNRQSTHTHAYGPKFMCKAYLHSFFFFKKK